MSVTEASAKISLALRYGLNFALLSSFARISNGDVTPASSRLDIVASRSIATSVLLMSVEVLTPNRFNSAVTAS